MQTGSREIRKTPLRRALARSAAMGVGVAYACVLLFGLDARYDTTRPPAPIRIAFAPAASNESVSTPLEMPTHEVSVLPLDVKFLRPPASLSAWPIPQVVITSEDPVLAPAPSRPPPPKPPDEYAQLQGRVYAERPGGSVMVMAMLLDENGTVQNAKIMVPSANPVGDLTYLMMLPGTKQLMNPPVPVGETQWVELRFRYESETALP